MNRRFRAAVTACVLAGAGVVLGQYLEAVVPTGDTPTEIIWDSAVNKVYCTNEQDASVTVISGETNEVITTIQVSEYPTFLCVNGDGSKLYCTCDDDANRRLVVIDARADTVLKTLKSPYWLGHMVYNESLAKLYISCNDDPVYRIVVLDATADTILRYISARGVGRLLWHPVTNRVFSCGADTIRVIDCLTDEIAVRTRGGGEVWCYNPVNNLVYLAARYQVYVLSPTGDSVVGSVPGWAYDVAAMPFPNKVYASGSAAGIQVIDGASNSVIDTIPVIAGRMVCDATRARAYAVGAGAYIIDARADTLIKTIPMGQALCRMCHNSVNSRVYVTDETGNVVYVIRDTSTGISEAVPAALAWTRRSAVTVVRRAMSWSGQTPAALVDLAGRRVLALNPGRNDLTRLAPGVYVAIASGTGEVRRVVKVE